MADVILQQAFPIYYGLEPKPFLIGPNPSGAAGATASFAYSFNDQNHKVYGVRVRNFYALPTDDDGGPPTEAQLALWEACRKIDDDQSVSLSFGQSTIIAHPTHQSLLCGADGVHWHPFPSMFPTQGNNSFNIEVKRLLPYPVIGGVQLLPMCAVALVTDRLVSDKSGPLR